MNTLRPVSERSVDPNLLLKENDDSISWEVAQRDEKPKDSAFSNFKKVLVYSIVIFSMGFMTFFHIAFFGANWVGLSIVFTGLPALLILAIYLKKRFLGNMSPQQKWILTEQSLIHSFKTWGKESTHTYAKDNIERIMFFPDRILIRLKSKQRGFLTHVMSPPVSFSLKIRQHLASEVKKRGVKALF